MLTARQISASFWPHNQLCIHFIFLCVTGTQTSRQTTTSELQLTGIEVLYSHKCWLSKTHNDSDVTSVCVSGEQWCLCTSTNKPENITKSKSTGQSLPSALCPRSTALNWDVSYRRLKFLTDSGEILELVWGTNGMFAAQVSAPRGCWADGVCLRDASASQ